MIAVFDTTTRTLRREAEDGESEPARSFKLTVKQFSFMVLLALRRTDGSSGWVELDELVARVPWWQGQSPESAGKSVWRFEEYPWFALVETQGSTTGPYRLRSAPRFTPDRDEALGFITNPPTPRRPTDRRRPGARSLDRLEMQAYDMIAQYGFYVPAVIDLIEQRIADPEKIRDARMRLTAYRILVTLDKNRGKAARAESRGKKALKLAERLNRKDDTCYLMDQIGGAVYIQGRAAEGESWFRKEIAFAETWGTNQAEHHLIGAYRGLTSTLRVQGRREEAIAALEESIQIAKKRGDDENLSLAGIEAERLKVTSATNVDVPPVPIHHLIARRMRSS